MRVRHPSGEWTYCSDNEIVRENEYYLENVRLPHINLTDSEVDGWIFSLLVSGKTLTTKILTKDEIYRKCKSYADRICPSPLLKEYVNSRIESLVERGCCEFDAETDSYHYLA